MADGEPGAPGRRPRSTRNRSPEPGVPPPPPCEACRDTGVLQPGEHVRVFCRCDQGLARQREAWFRQCGVPLARRGETLAAFQSLPGTEKALAAAREFLSGGIRWLLLYGPAGNGKSHLTIGLTLASLQAGQEARWVNTFLLLSELRAAPDLARFQWELGRVPVLALDELIWGTDLEARWVEEIITRRYLEKMPLVVATNRDIKEIPVPVVSRFHELGRVVLNRGKDYRRGKTG